MLSGILAFLTSLARGTSLTIAAVGFARALSGEIARSLFGGRSLGLAYALNMHMAQGVTTDKAIAVMSGSESNLSNQRLFNVTVTRVRDDLTLHTDNKDRLISAIERNEGNKTSALETVGRLEIDAPRDSAAGKGRTDKTFNPEVPADLLKSDSMDLSKLRVAVEPRVPDKPFPQKDISLEI